MLEHLTRYNNLQNLHEREHNVKNIVAMDTVLNSKLFVNVEKRKDLLSIINHDYHAYELITKNEVRIYFDIDGLDLTRECCDNFLKLFIETLNTLQFKNEKNEDMEILLTLKDLYIACNDKINKYTKKPSNNIHSLHIIIPSFCMRKEQQKLLVKYLNNCGAFENYKLDEMFDTRVYSKNQQFRIPNQSKNSNQIKLINYKNEEIDFQYFQVNYTRKACKIQFTKIYNHIQTNNDKELLKLSREELIDFILTDESIDRHKLFNQTKKWALITRIILKENKNTDYELFFDIAKWNEASVQLAKNPNYTIEKNNEYINKVSDEYTHADIFCLYKIINEYSSKYSVYSDLSTIQPHTIQKLNSIYSEQDTNEIIEHIIQLPTKPKSKSHDHEILEKQTKNNEKTIINLKTGFIVYENNTKINMFYDNLPITNETLFESVENINEAKDKLIDLIQKHDTTKVPIINKSKTKKTVSQIIKNESESIKTLKQVICLCMILKSRWGTRKTSLIMEHLINHEKYKNARILLITESNALNSKLQKDYNFISHQDKKYKSPNTLHNKARVVCSIQSLWRLSQNTHYDVVIVDEITSILTAYTSTKTFAQLPRNLKTHNIYDLMIKLISHSNLSLLCDADISEDYIKLLKQSISKDVKIVKNTQLAFTDYKFKIQTNDERFMYNLTDKLIDGNKISFASTSKRRLDELVLALNQGEIKKTILTITQDGVILYKNGIITEKIVDTEHKKEKQEILKNIDEYITKNDVDLFCYSPTIKTGISFNTQNYFNYTFAIGDCNSVVYSEFLQMLFRVRHLINREIFIYLDKSQFFNRQNQSINTTRSSQNAKDVIFNHITKNMDIFPTGSCSHQYQELQIQNINIACNSKYNYVANFISSLKYHKLDYSYESDTNEYEKLQEELKQSVLSRKEQLREINLNKWLDIKTMTYDEFSSHKNKMKEDCSYYKNMSDDEQASYSKTKQIFMLLKVNDSNYDNDFIQSSINSSNTQAFYELYIEYDAYKKVEDIRTIFTDNYEYKDPNQQDHKNEILNKNYKRLILKMFNYFLNDDFVFTPLTITNSEFKKIITDDKNISLINELFRVLNTSKTNITFKPTNKSHIKQIYNFIQKTLGKMDITLKYLDHHTERANAKMLFKPNNKLLKYNRVPIINKSKSLSHIKNEAIKTSRQDNLKLFTEKQVESYSKKLESGKQLAPKIMVKYLKSLLYIERASLPLMDTSKQYDVVNHITFRNDIFEIDQEKSNDEIIVIKDKSYKLENNLKSNVLYIITNTRMKIHKPIYRVDNSYRGYKPIINKKTTILKEKIIMKKPNEDDDEIEIYVNDLLHNIVDNLCLNEELKQQSIIVRV